jgi:hypothetical protein
MLIDVIEVNYDPRIIERGFKLMRSQLLMLLNFVNCAVDMRLIQDLKFELEEKSFRPV